MAKRPFPSFLIFRDQQGNWSWNFAGPGGRILAKSAQSYTASQGCVRAIKLLKGSSEIPVVGSPAVREAVNEARAAASAAAAKSTEQKADAPAKATSKTAAKKKV
jgi:uncharacterized protein